MAQGGETQGGTTQERGTGKGKRAYRSRQGTLHITKLLIRLF